MFLRPLYLADVDALLNHFPQRAHFPESIDVTDDLAHSSIRFGLGRFTTEEEVDYTARLVVEKVKKLRDMSPLYEMAKEGVDLSRVEWANPH